MNNATLSPEIFMDISTDDRIPKNPKGIIGRLKKESK